MPTLNVDDFDEVPHVGDKVRVTGKIKSIDEDDGKVEVSYDEVKIVEEHKKKKKRSYDNDHNDEFDQYGNPVIVREQMSPNSQSLDQALSQAFPNTQ